MKEKNQRKKYPHILDLSEKTVMNSSIILKDENAGITDIHGGKRSDGLIVVQKNKLSFIWLQVSCIAICGLVIIFLVHTAKSYTAARLLIVKMTDATKKGYIQLFEGGKKVQSQDVNSAKSIFDEAYQQFKVAQEQIWFLKNEPELKKYTAILDTGTRLADAGNAMLDILERAKKISAMIASDMSDMDTVGSTTPRQTALTELAIVHGKMLEIKNTLIESLKSFDAVSSVVPTRYRAVVEKGAQVMRASEKMLDSAIAIFPGLMELLGGNVKVGAKGSSGRNMEITATSDKPHRTLILLQNSDEVRPTGGFIGSFINLSAAHGRIENLQLEDVYDLDGYYDRSLRIQRSLLNPLAGEAKLAPEQYAPKTAGVPASLSPPPEIARLTDRWFFRDSNFSPDFRVSGKKAIEFFEREAESRQPNQQKADTVIAVNHTMLGKILAITGPLDVPGLQAPLTEGNYREVLTYMIETKRAGTEDPKKILKEMLPLIQKQLFQGSNMERLQQMLLEEIVQKNISGYSRSKSVQQLFVTLGMDGAMMSEEPHLSRTAEQNTRQTDNKNSENEDYLAIIASSFSANKSDAYIKQDIEHDTVIEPSGDIYNQLTIRRTHQWSAATLQRWKKMLKPFGFTDFPEHWVKIFGSGENKVALRVYIPTGSELIAADHIALENIKTMDDPDLNRTYLSFDMMTNPGETRGIKIRYKLPFSLNNFFANTYTFNIQKQLGTPTSTFTKRLSSHNFMNLTRTYPTDFITESDGSLMIGKPLYRDYRFSWLFTREERVP